MLIYNEYLSLFMNIYKCFKKIFYYSAKNKLKYHLLFLKKKINK